MKIKGVMKNLNFFFKLQSDTNKNIPRNFSEDVVGSVGSVQLQIVPVPACTCSQGIQAPSNA